MKNLFLSGIFLFLSGLSVFSQNQTPENESLRKVVLHLPPGDNNPRNSEGDFITLKNGRILFVYSHYTGKSSSDHAPAYLAGRFSNDGGKTWSTPFVITENREDDLPK